MGIDYGQGLTNIDRETGIRFGIINQNQLTQAWSDSSEAVYENPCCPQCSGEIVDYDDEIHADYVLRQAGYRSNCEHACESCEIALDSDEIQPESPSSFSYESDGIIAEQTSEDGDIFVTKSPFYTVCGFCSPCAPGAGYLMSQDSEDCKAYCFPHDWFEGDKAPYKVFRVEDDSEVLSEEQENEKARIQHEIKMTDDLIYAEWYKAKLLREDIEQNGINEE